MTTTRTSAVTLRRLAAAYLPLLGVGVWLSLRHHIGADPGGDPARDLPLRGTGLAPPLFLPAALFAGALLSRRGDAAGITGTVVAGAVGVAFTAGSTVNLPNDLAAAGVAGTPTGVTIGIAALHWVFGPALAVSALMSVRARLRASDHCPARWAGGLPAGANHEVDERCQDGVGGEAAGWATEERL